MFERGTANVEAVSFGSDVPSKLMAWKFTPNVRVTGRGRHVHSRSSACDLFFFFWWGMGGHNTAAVATAVPSPV